MSVINDSLHVEKTLSCGNFAPPDGSIGGNALDPVNPATVDKLDHQYIGIQKQLHGSANAAKREIIHIANGDGNLASVRFGTTVALTGDAIITCNLYKNGTTVLSAPVVLTSALAAYAFSAAGIASAPYVAGDVFEAVITTTIGTGGLGQGQFTRVVFQEAYES